MSATVFLIIITFPVGLLLGGLVGFGAVPLYYYLKKVPPEKRNIRFAKKAALALLCAGLFTLTVCAGEYLNKLIVRDDYWKFQGDAGYWRMPLEEPYEIGMRGSMDTGAIGRWRQEGQLVGNILGFEKRGPLVAGQLQDTAASRPGWFLFDCRTGDVQIFSAIELFYNACRSAGFELPVAVETVRHNWYVYWGIVRDTKGS